MAEYRDDNAESFVRRHTPILDGQPIVNYGFSRNSIWGGWGNNNCTNNCYEYYAAQFQVTVPGIPTTVGLASDSIWVGNGGANGQLESLSQDGISEHSYNDIVTYNAFYESNNCGKSNQEYDLYPIHKGDLMYFYTDETGYDILDDQSSGNYQTKQWGCGSLDSAEFIIERNGNQNTAPLAQYGTVYATNAQYEDTGGNWWGVDENSGGYGDGFYSWGLWGSNCGCYLETQSTPTTTNHASTWYWTWRSYF